MRTIPITTRLSPEEAERVDDLAARLGLDRSALIKQLVRRGMGELAREQACNAYRRGEATLSRAAEMAGLGDREMLVALRDYGVELNYGRSDLHADLEADI